MNRYSPSIDTLKDAVLATTRALSRDQKLKKTLNKITSLEISLPSPPKKRSELAPYRGKADSIALTNRYTNEKIRADAGSKKLNLLLDQWEKQTYGKLSKPKELTDYQNDPPAYKCIGKVKYK